MSEDVTAPADTVASVKAANAALVSDAAASAAVDAANALPAPSDPILHYIRLLEDRVALLTAHVAGDVPGVEAVVNAASPAIAIAVPSATPILARLPMLEATVNAMLAAFGTHFGGKIPLPAPIAPAPAAAAS